MREVLKIENSCGKTDICLVDSAKPKKICKQFFSKREGWSSEKNITKVKSLNCDLEPVAAAGNFSRTALIVWLEVEDKKVVDV